MIGPDNWNTLAVDAKSLDGLKAQARRSPQEALQAAAREFEAVFMTMMLKSMRDATPKDGLFESDQTRTFTAMLDGELARGAAGRGLGLAEVLVRQLSRPQADAAVAGPATPAAPARAAGAPDGAAPGSRGFIQRLWAPAQEASRASGIPARFMIGHAALETGWGEHEIRHPDGRPSHNVFGIKAGRGWNGPTVEVPTTEYVNGRPVRTSAKFRAYGSYGDAFRDYARLLAENPRYARVLEHGGDAGRYARELQRAGYATDPRYGEKLTGVLRSAALQTAATAANA